MTRYHFAAALLAFGSLAMLPACSTTPTYTSSAAPMHSSPELSSGMVRQVQTALQQQGLYTGSIDGLWGPQTQNAVMGFQQSHGLRPSGELNTPTLAALNVPAGNGAPATPPPSDATSSAAPATQPVPLTPPATTSSAAPAAPAMAPATPPVATSSNAPAVTPAP